MQKLLGRMAWLHVLLPVTDPGVGKLYGVKSATPCQKGFVMWLPCTIKEIELQVKGFVTNQRGLFRFLDANLQSVFRLQLGYAKLSCSGRAITDSARDS
eukprot:2969834-Rhodomonas_salina.1